jgi:ketosteroid isomerase-like protein
MSRTPREVAGLVRRIVAGEPIAFADLFAADGVLTYPFAPPGWSAELTGREAIRAHFSGAARSRELFEIQEVQATVRETDDPEVVVTEITHHGWSRATESPYRLTAIGVIRVRDGEIVRYDDYMDPIALARLLDRASDLAVALTAHAT